MHEPVRTVDRTGLARRPRRRKRAHDPGRDRAGADLQWRHLCRDDGHAAGSRGLRHRLQPERRHHPVASTISKRSMSWNLDDGMELRMWLAPIQGGPAERAAAAHRRSHRLRHLRYRIQSPRPFGRLRWWRRAGRSRRDEITAAIQSIPPLQAINIVDARGACRGVLDAGSRHRRAARGCRPSQRARQARRRTGAAKGCRRRRHGSADQPGLGRNGAEDRGDGRAVDGRRLGADGAGGTNG